MENEIVIILMNSEAVSSLDYFRRALRNKGARTGWTYVKTANGVFSLPAIFLPVGDKSPEVVREKARKMFARYPGAEYLLDTGEIVRGDKTNQRTQKTN